MVTLRAISAKMNRNRKKPIETRKLTQQQKKLLVEKIKELEDSYTGRGKISSEKLAKIIGPRFLKRSISYKIQGCAPNVTSPNVTKSGNI